jgi:hypothetical protein
MQDRVVSPALSPSRVRVAIFMAPLLGALPIPLLFSERPDVLIGALLLMPHPGACPACLWKWKVGCAPLVDPSLRRCVGAGWGLAVFMFSALDGTGAGIGLYSAAVLAAVLTDLTVA